MFLDKAKEAIARIQAGMKCSYEEAVEIYKSDCEVDKGIPHEWDLTEEQQKIAKKYTITGQHTKKRDRKTPIKRERKENSTKANLIAELAGFLESLGICDVKIANPERQIAFSVDNNAFELTLVQKRAKK
jgi:uncharacterized protein (DUF2344 family)